MNSHTFSPIEVHTVPESYRAAALDLIFSHLKQEERGRQIEAILTGFASKAISDEGLLGAYRNKALTGAILSHLIEGKNAQVWMPRLIEGEENATSGTLLQSAVKWLEKNQVCLAEILLESVTPEEEQILRGAGFDFLADLLYLVCPENAFPDHSLTDDLEYEAYTVHNHERLIRIVEETYHNTLDCPKINNVRRVEDVLEGYRETGVFSPSRWLIVRHNNEDIGCLLLTDHPQYENMELVYMGIIPIFRGHGWGAYIAQHAQLVAHEAGRRRLVLAVDSANHPAIKMYASVGFQSWDTRRIYIKIFPQ